MSNRDGRNAKPRGKSGKFKIGRLCPRCKKSKLERVYDRKHPKKHYRYYFECPGCHLTNF